MRERPIIFGGEMVRAILDGAKQQTRRVVKLPKWIAARGGSLTEAWVDPGLGGGAYLKVPLHDDDTAHRVRCPYGQPGDRLWVRETWAIGSIYDGMAPSEIRLDALPAVRYPATQKLSGVRLRPSIHMPRWAARITLEITEVRIERVQDISEEDAEREGLTKRGHWWDVGADWEGDGIDTTARGAFAHLWDSINAKRGYSWTANPWVWVLTFRRGRSGSPEQSGEGPR